MLQLQRASAGSGKTEQLARHYLQLFFNPDNATLDPASVIATTFTREAAGEIAARIFRLLARACNEAPLRASLIEGTHFPIPTEASCRELLRRFVDRVDRLSIGTIDALFAQQARALSLDLGIPAAWEIADTLTSETLAREALLQTLTADSSIREAWSLLHHGTRTLSFLEKGISIFEKNRWIARAEPFYQDLKPGLPLRFAAVEEVQSFLKTFEVPLTAKGKPDGRWLKAIEQLKLFFVRSLLLKDLLESGSLLKNCFSQEPTFYGTPIPTAFVNFFLPFLQNAMQERQRLESLREAALQRMMKQYEKARQGISFHAGKYTFSEIEEVVQREHHHLSLEEIALRMDLRTEHLLLDEYQDTSQRQHDFLSPLVGNVLAKGGEVFVVGDVKQGIYGWRGGKRHLLSLLEKEHLPFQKEITPLNQSYRSSPAVLEAVNEVFGALKNEELVNAMEGGDAFKKAAARWSTDFQMHVGAPSVAGLQGRVRVHGVAESEDKTEEPMQGVIEKAVQLVEKHLQENPEREIAILVRRTKFIPQLLQKLRAQEIIASGEGGNPLADTLAVELLLSLLTWLDHPGHTAAYDHVLHSPLQNLITQKNAATHLRQQLLDHGAAATLRSWALEPRFYEACSVYERGRVEQLLALAEKFDAAGGGRCSDLVKRVRRERVETPLPANVRVLTFHASKGLEFESVILMDLDVDITAGGDRGLRVQQDENNHFFIQGSQEVMSLQGRETLLLALQEEQWAEMLSLLYVGMTRAASYLDLLFFEKPSRKKTMAQWLRVSKLQACEFSENAPRTTEAASSFPQAALPPHQSVERVYQKFSQRLPSQEQEGNLVSLRQLLQDSSARKLGTERHAELAKIEWDQPHALNIKQGETVFKKEFFLEQWRHLEVVQLELWREKRFAIVQGKEFINGAFDRVVIGKNKLGVSIVAEIIDFKTGGSAQQSELEKRYQPQLKAYERALQTLLPSLEKITTRLVWV